jgi:ABC-type antimicrobial peptide transport system permease subunit
MIGVVLVGLASILRKVDEIIPHHQPNLGEIMSGIGLLQFGILCGTVGFILEEKFMRNYKHLDPISIVGAEGLSATCLWLVILPLFYIISCSSNFFCTNGHLEDTPGAWEDYMANPNLLY